MARPQFSTKELLISVLWLSVGMALITASLRRWNISPRQSDDWLADIQPAVSTAARVVGWVCVCWAIIALFATRRRTRVLICALCGVIPGAVVGSLVRDAAYPAMNGYERNEKMLIPYLGMAIGSLVLLAIAAAASQPSDSDSPRPES